MKTKFQRKNLIMLMVTSIICLMFFSFSHIYAAEPTVLDPIIDGGMAMVSEPADLLLEIFLGAIMCVFSPSLDTLALLGNGEGVSFVGSVISTFSNQQEYGAYLYNSPIINQVYGMARLIGMVLCSIIFLFCLFFCVCGKANDIKVSPIRLILNYIIAIGGIYLSFNAILWITEIVSKVWTRWVFGIEVGRLQDGMAVVRMGSTTVSLSSISDAVASGEAFDILGISCSAFSGYSNSYWYIGIFAFFFTWKLIKCILKMFLEIAERYLSSMILLLIMPAIIPTTLTPGLSQVFKSYTRMVVSQMGLLLVNCGMFKLFISVLAKGGWTNSFLNFMFALGYVKIFQRFDTYLLTMGLNTAQAGGGLMDSLGGAGRFIGDAIRNLGRGLQRATDNTGKALMERGIHNNDAGMHQLGSTLTNIAHPVSSIAKGIDKGAMEQQSFVEGVAKRPAALAHSNMVYTGGTMEGWNNLMKNGQIASTVNKQMAQNGISPADVHSAKKNQNGVWTFQNANGDSFATWSQGGGFRMMEHPAGSGAPINGSLPTNGTSSPINGTSTSPSQSSNTRVENPTTGSATAAVNMESNTGNDSQYPVMETDVTSVIDDSYNPLDNQMEPLYDTANGEESDMSGSYVESNNTPPIEDMDFADGYEQQALGSYAENSTSPITDSNSESIDNNSSGVIVPAGQSPLMTNEQISSLVGGNSSVYTDYNNESRSRMDNKANASETQLAVVETKYTANGKERSRYTQVSMASEPPETKGWTAYSHPNGDTTYVSKQDCYMDSNGVFTTKKPENMERKNEDVPIDTESLDNNLHNVTTDHVDTQTVWSKEMNTPEGLDEHARAMMEQTERYSEQY